MIHASLFSGIGGFDLAAEWAGLENAFHCEWNEFGQKILKYYWPHAKTYGDITKTDFTIWRGRIDVLTGGFPCQPFSLAGNRNGIDDDRYLWPEYLRAIREIQPTFVVGENVTGILTMGERTLWAKVDSRNLVRYEDYDHYEAVYTRQEKMLVSNIIQDLEKEGYEVQVFAIPAAGVGAPHKRERVWFVAHKNTNKDGRRSYFRKEESKIWKFGDISSGNNEQLRANYAKTWSTANTANSGVKSMRKSEIEAYKQQTITDTKSEQSKWLQLEQREYCQPKQKQFRRSNSQLGSEYVANPNGFRLWSEKYRIGESGQFNKKSAPNDWSNFPTVSPICNGDDGISDRLDGITFSKWRSESIKAGGNAVVPQVPLKIFQAINLFTNN